MDGKMPHYRKKLPSSLSHSTSTGKLAQKESFNYKVRFYGSFFALIFFLAILYGRSKGFVTLRQGSPEKVIDYSSPGWKEHFDKLADPSLLIDLSKNNKEIEPLILIIKDYRYWENAVNQARQAGDKKKEEYALSTYRQAMEKIARYSTESIKRAEEEIEKSGWRP